MNKNKKITKALALTLAGIATVGAGSIAISKSKDAQAFMRIFGGLKTIITGKNASNGSAYQGVPKSSSTITNQSFSSVKASSSSASVSTSRVLNGSNGAINSGSVTSNGSPYQGTPKTSSTINNQAFTPGNGTYKAIKVPTTGSDVTVHEAPKTQMKTIEKQIATSNKTTSPTTQRSSLKLQISGSGNNRTITKIK